TRRRRSQIHLARAIQPRSTVPIRRPCRRSWRRRPGDRAPTRVVRYDQTVRLAAILVIAFAASSAHADDSKLRKEDVPIQNKQTLRGKNKLCCGYPLA